MTPAIVTLVNQASQTLDIVAPQLKEEATKKVAEIKQQIPTEDSIKQMMMDEITSRGPELVCSIEARNRIDFIYNKLKSLLKKLQNVVDKSKDKLLKLQEQLSKVQKIIAIIEGIFVTLKTLIPIFNVVVQVSKIGIKFLTGLAANGAVTVKLKDLIDKSKSKIKEIKNSIKVFEKRIAKILKKALIPSAILATIIGIINLIKSAITAALGLVESYYLKYTLMCDVEGDSIEDEDFADAINNAPNNVDINLIGDDLLPNTIERIRNAKFEVIQYRIA
jgi:hypothetical protein